MQNSSSIEDQLREIKSLLKGLKVLLTEAAGYLGLNPQESQALAIRQI